jgi:hypothetical protein
MNARSTAPGGANSGAAGTSTGNTGTLDLYSLAAQLKHALRVLDQLETAVDRHALFLTVPRPEDLQRWCSQLRGAARRVFDAYEKVDDEIAEVEREQYNEATLP